MALPGREPDNGVREITITPMTSRAKAERAAGTGCSARNTAPRITRYPSIRYRDRGGGRARDNPHILASSTPFVKKTKERREAERARRHLHMQLSEPTCSSWMLMAVRHPQWGSPCGHSPATEPTRLRTGFSHRRYGLVLANWLPSHVCCAPSTGSGSLMQAPGYARDQWGACQKTTDGILANICLSQ